MSANNAWRAVVAAILSQGRLAPSPHGECMEVLGSFLCIEMAQPLLTIIDRKLNYTFCAAEAIHILTGRNDSAFLRRHISRYDDFTHDGIHIQWAYGPKFVEQAWYCAEVLLGCSESRRSVMTLWRENPRWEDPPCTIALQFIVRNRCLETMVFMRSSDVWMGLPYDMFAFSMMSAYVMLLVNKRAMRIDRLGQLNLLAGSQHLYTKHLTRAAEAIKGPAIKVELFQPALYGNPEELVDDLNTLMEGKPPKYLPHATTIRPDS